MRALTRARFPGVASPLAMLAALAAVAAIATMSFIGFRLLAGRGGTAGGRLLLAAIQDGPGGAAQVERLRDDGTPAGLVTRGNGAPADPIALPDGAIVYSDAVPGEPGARSLYRCRADGGGAARLTFGRDDDGHPELLPDGRIAFERRFRESGRPPAWMTIHPDGTLVSLYRDGSAPAASASGPAAGPAAGPATPGASPPALTSVVDPTRRTGTLLCLDAYTSRLPQIADLPRGAIRRVVASRAGDASRAILAEAPVFRDGSFLIEVPADTPLRLALLDEADRELASLESGLWVRGNENRGCIGCHEQPDLAPSNRRPLALVKKEAYVP